MGFFALGISFCRVDMAKALPSGCGWKAVVRAADKEKLWLAVEGPDVK